MSTFLLPLTPPKYAIIDLIWYYPRLEAAAVRHAYGAMAGRRARSGQNATDTYL